MNLIPRLLAGLAGAALLVTAAPAVASAADFSHVDAVRDVRSGTLDSDAIRRPEPRERAGDVRRLRVDHRTDTLVLTFRTRGALPTGRYVVTAEVRTPGGTFEVSHGRMFGMTFSDVSVDSEPIACAGYRTEIDASRKRTTMVIPTSCLGTPAWVRVGGGTGIIRGKRLYVDDALRDGRVRDTIKLSPRIARG
ncbi:hypothetical protein [Pimelobacter sp. 30-1]|uniref:hypothetical protein n=1 Tax=Pimelobacter sp. 30-1 TaxID=2004991 RepID=UPI001C05D761|nr:hypothetical protein [Pimelobacter sp. 30-1]MBU2696190.1 hypothetical protein [Pimelobacter sp. 30-1]